MTEEELSTFILDNDFSNADIDAVMRMFTFLEKRNNEASIHMMLRLSKLPLKSPKTFENFDFSHQDTIRETFKESLFYKDGLTLTIRCFIPELLTFIDEHIRGFFMMHNFGTRQRKGFGSFTVDISTEPNAPKGFDLVGKYCPNAYYCKLNDNVSADALLDAVWVISAFLRSGFNRGEGNYVRGFVFRYFQREKNPLANDKAFVFTN